MGIPAFEYRFKFRSGSCELGVRIKLDTAILFLVLFLGLLFVKIEVADISWWLVCSPLYLPPLITLVYSLGKLFFWRAKA